MSKPFMSARVAVILVLVSAASLLGLALLNAFAPDLRARNSSGADAVSRSAVGFAALQEFLNLAGVTAEIDRGPLTRGLQKPSLTILTPDIATGARELDEYERSGPVLVILPKWAAVENPLKREWVLKADAYPQAIVADKVSVIAKGATIARYSGSVHGLLLQPGKIGLPNFPYLKLATIESIQTIGGPSSLLVAPNYGPVLSMVRRGRYPIYILSEPDLMNNHGLADETTAKTALAIIKALRQGGGPVAIDVTLNGLGRSPSLLRAVFEPPFLGATICALVAALLMGLHLGARFGAPLRAERVFARGKKALADNTADLVRMMGREAAMAKSYVAGSRGLALARLGAARSAPPEQDELLAAIEKNSDAGESLAALSREADAARSGADLMRIAQKAFKWRQGVTRGHQ